MFAINAADTGESSNITFFLYGGSATIPSLYLFAETATTGLRR
jgi:hypothetical protein